jgi:cbb3-type cytochrome oxidase subunit 3
MFFAILNAGLIYGVIWLFERKRRAMHEFDFDMLAVIPPFVYLGLNLLILVLGLGPWAQGLALLVFVGVLFWMLWRRAKLSVGRASAYTALVLVVNLALDVLLASRPR